MTIFLRFRQGLFFYCGELLPFLTRKKSGFDLYKRVFNMENGPILPDLNKISITYHWIFTIGCSR
jgi:hypothetical protein